MTDRTNADLSLDYEDLVDELDQFELKAKDLQTRISQFMQNAQQALEGGEDPTTQQGGEPAD